MSKMTALPANPTNTDLAASIAEVHQCVDGLRGEMKRDMGLLKTALAKVTSAVEKILPDVDLMREERVRADERKKVLAEVEMSQAGVRKERREWFAPIAAGLAVLVATLGVGWANDHFNHHPEAKATTTISTTVEKPR